jgi:hypothetical protein
MAITSQIVGDWSPNPSIYDVSIAANYKYASPYTLGVNNYIDVLNVYSAADYPTVKIKGIIYSDNAGTPDSLLATTEEHVGLSKGFYNILKFSSQVNLTAGNYWLGFIVDSAISIECNYSSSYKYVRNADTYSDGPTDPFGTYSLYDGQFHFLLYGAQFRETLDASKSVYYAVLSTEVTVGVSQVVYYAVLKEVNYQNKSISMIIT